MARIFNIIITSLKALDESFSSRNHVRKLLRALPTKWRPKVMAIEESKDLSTLPLDELIGNLKVYEVVLEKDLMNSKRKKEKYKSLALKARKFLSEEEATFSDSDDEDGVKEDKKEKYDRKCFKCGDPNHFISDYPKHSFNDQKAFVVGCWSDSGDDCKKEEICLMTLDDNEVLSDTPYYSSSYLDNESWENEYDKLCKISLKIIHKSKQLKAKNEELKREACELKAKIEELERNKEISLECESCVGLQSKVSSLTLKLASFKNSSSSLQEMLEMQKPPKDKHGLGYIEDVRLDVKVKDLRARRVFSPDTSVINNVDGGFGDDDDGDVSKGGESGRYEKKMKFVEQPIGPAPDYKTADPNTIDKYYESVNVEQEVACLMLLIKAFHAYKQETRSVSKLLSLKDEKLFEHFGTPRLCNAQ
ncbi:hypothetical protein Tco_0792294 [Tanacetum coccineum]